MALLETYISPKLGQLLKSDPRNTFINMTSFIIADSMFTTYQDPLEEQLPILYSNFIHLALRKVNLNFNLSDALTISKDLFQYRAECYKEYNENGQKIAYADIEIRVSEILLKHVEFQYKFKFSDLKGGSWSEICGPVLWTILHIIFSHVQHSDTEPEIIKCKSILLQVLDMFITCSLCKHHYKQHYESMMVILKEDLNDGEKLMIKIHNFITSLIHRLPIHWASFSSKDEHYLQLYRQVANHLMASQVDDGKS